MRIALLILSILTTQLSLAYQIKSSAYLDSARVLNQEVVISCGPNEASFCVNICGDTTTCHRQEPLCLNCSGTSSSLLRVIFTRLTSYFEVISNPVPESSVASFLAKDSYILVSPQSIYNFYRPWNDPEIQAQFASLCPAGSRLPVLAVLIDEQSRPKNLVYSLCEISENKTEAFLIHLKQTEATKAELH